MLDKLGWQYFALGSAFFAGLTNLFAKMGVVKTGEAEINSNLATFIRTVVALAVSALLITWRAEWEPLNKLSARALVMLVLSGLGTGLSWLCFFRALQLGPASGVVPIDKLSVAFVMLLAFLFLGERPEWNVLLGGLLVVAGVVLTVYDFTKF